MGDAAFEVVICGFASGKGSTIKGSGGLYHKIGDEGSTRNMKSVLKIGEAGKAGLLRRMYKGVVYRREPENKL